MPLLNARISAFLDYCVLGWVQHSMDLKCKGSSCQTGILLAPHIAASLYQQSPCIASPLHWSLYSWLQPCRDVLWKDVWYMSNWSLTYSSVQNSDKGSHGRCQPITLKLLNSVLAFLSLFGNPSEFLIAQTVLGLIAQHPRSFKVRSLQMPLLYGFLTWT